MPWWGGERRARYVTPDLKYYCEGGQESSARVINGMRKRKKGRKKTYTDIPSTRSQPDQQLKPYVT